MADIIERGAAFLANGYFSLKETTPDSLISVDLIKGSISPRHIIPDQSNILLYSVHLQIYGGSYKGQPPSIITMTVFCLESEVHIFAQPDPKQHMKLHI